LPSPVRTQTSVQELKQTQFNVGCNTPVGVSYINPAIMKEFGGLKFKMICGYPGTASLPIALARQDRYGDGRVDGLEEPFRGRRRRGEAHYPIGTRAP
jgi:hypothetical protein